MSSNLPSKDLSHQLSDTPSGEKVTQKVGWSRSKTEILNSTEIFHDIHIFPGVCGGKMRRAG